MPRFCLRWIRLLLVFIIALFATGELTVNKRWATSIHQTIFRYVWIPKTVLVSNFSMSKEAVSSVSERI